MGVEVRTVTDQTADVSVIGYLSRLDRCVGLDIRDRCPTAVPVGLTDQTACRGGARDRYRVGHVNIAKVSTVLFYGMIL